MAWAKGHKRRTGKWTTHASGPFHDAPVETWLAIDMALRKGRRGLQGGSSFARVLAQHFGVLNPQKAPRLSITAILRWADAHLARHGTRPTRDSGPITEALGETWMAIHKALYSGRRGLPGGSSLAKLLDENGRGKVNQLPFAASSP